MAPSDLERRAARGGALLGARGVAIGVLSMVANLVLARLLAPRDFGLVALGTTLLLVGTTLGGGGLASTLIARSRAPERYELGVMLGIQLAAAGALAATGLAVGL